MRAPLVLVVLALAGCGPGESGPAPALGPGGFRSGPERPIPERLSRGEELFSKDRLAEAAAEFRAVLDRDAKNVQALVGLSRIAGRMEDGAASLRFISRAAELRPDDGSIVNQLGVAQVACGRKQEASKTFERAARMAPGDPLILLNSAQNRADLGDWPGASDLARRASELLPKDATPWLLLGRFEMRQEKFARAVPLLQEASHRAPENAIVHYHLGKSLAAVGRREEAREAFRVALQGNPPPEVQKEVETLLTGK